MSQEQKLRKWVGVGYAAKVVGLGALALIGGARADAPAGTDLALKGNKDKTTVLHPYSEGAPSLPLTTPPTPAPRLFREIAKRV